MPSFTPSQTDGSCSPLALALEIASSENRDEFVLKARGPCLDNCGSRVDRGAIVALIDHACGSHLRRRFGRCPLATLNFRIDWLAKPEARSAVYARPHLIAHHGATALVAINVTQSGTDQPLATAISQMIVGIAPGGTATPFIDEMDVSETFDFSSFGKLLGLRYDNEAIYLPMARHLVGNAAISAIHGGIIAAALDRSASSAIDLHGSMTNWRPLNIWVEYLRPAIAGADNLMLTSSTKRTGRTIASVDVIAKNSGGAEVIARAGVKFVATDQKNAA